jgi:hypothetical protein
MTVKKGDIRHYVTIDMGVNELETNLALRFPGLSQRLLASLLSELCVPSELGVDLYCNTDSTKSPLFDDNDKHQRTPLRDGYLLVLGFLIPLR